MLMDRDETFMAHALKLAQQGGRAVAPNPMVGAVVVHNGSVIGQGFHQRYGGAHAEVHALESVDDRSLLSSSTLYVTLEPCSHFGKTAPCADLVISSGIRRVVVGCRDPFPAVAGRGIAKLTSAGVSVTENILRDQCTFANRRFITAHQEGRPYIILKWAQTSDGFMAPEERSRLSISCQESHRLVHEWRAHEMGILIGRSTAEIDNPQLTVRLAAGENPTRIVIDPQLSLDPSLNVFDPQAPTIVVNTVREGFQGSVHRLRIEPASWSCQEICSALARQGLTSVLVEGGARTLAAFIESGMWDEARIFTAPTQLARGVAAPHLAGIPEHESAVGIDTLRFLYNPDLPSRLGLSDYSLLKTTAAVHHAVEA